MIASVRAPARPTSSLAPHPWARHDLLITYSRCGRFVDPSISLSRCVVSVKSVGLRMALAIPFLYPTRVAVDSTCANLLADWLDQDLQVLDLMCNQALRNSKLTYRG